MTDKSRIAIIGSGIAGLTLTRLLNANKYEISIFEKKDDFGEVGAAISIFPNALCVLDELNLLPFILRKSGEIKKVFLKSSKGEVLSKSEPKGDYPVICMHRADLHDILLNNINARLYKGYNLKSIICLKNDKPQLIFENGETKEFDAVIGADGIFSTVRQHVINDGEPIYRGYNIWRGIVKTEFDIGYASETYGIGKRVGIVPIKDGVYGWWATCNEQYSQDDKPEGTSIKLNRLFGNWHHPIPDFIKGSNRIIKNNILDRKLRKGWTKGNVTLIGDAAHPTTPNLGQGGCMAIEGAYILAKSINKYGLTANAYKRYEELHFPRVKIIINRSLKIGRIGQISHPLLVRIRNKTFKLLPSTLVMKMIDRYFTYRVTSIKI